MIEKEKKIKNFNETEKAVLIGVNINTAEETIQAYLDELQFLAETAGAETVKVFTQKLDKPDSKYFIGKGKLEEVKEYMDYHGDIDMVIFDDDLTGKQTSLLEEYLEVKIIDRSTLILDIFAKRAQKSEAKTQVELAQLQYLLPRLRGLWTHLERQRGGIGMRGPGEQEIETDRRIIKDKIRKLKENLDKIEKQEFTQRKRRDELIRVALVGYTNVGKSTIMRLLTKSDVFVEDKLFATLDTTVRKMVIENMPFLLSDTVGFIRKLPHHLIESFKSTLAETNESDILLHIIDISHPQYEEQIKTVNNLLNDLNSGEKTIIHVFNKIDIFMKNTFDELLDPQTKQELFDKYVENIKNSYGENSIIISAKNNENIEQFRELLKIEVEKKYKIRYPYRVKSW